MKTLSIAVVAMLMLVEAPASEARAADACEATLEIIAPAPEDVVPTPLSELTPSGRLSLANADPPFGPSGPVTIVRKETMPFPSPGGPVRYLALGEGHQVELRHLAGRRPEWAQLGLDGKLASQWRFCRLYDYTGEDWHEQDRIGTLSIHQPGPIQDPYSRRLDAEDLAAPAVVPDDSCEMTIEIISPMPPDQHPAVTSRLNELSPLAQRALAKHEVPWEASGSFLLVNPNDTEPFPPVGQVRYIDLQSPYSVGIELRHLPGQRPDFVMLGLDGTPTSSPPVQCPTKYYEGFTLPQEDRLTVVRIHPPGPIEEPPGPASEARNHQ